MVYLKILPVFFSCSLSPAPNLVLQFRLVIMVGNIGSIIFFLNLQCDIICMRVLCVCVYIYIYIYICVKILKTLKNYAVMLRLVSDIFPVLLYS